MTSGFALVFPFFSIGIEDTVTKEIIHGTMEFRSLDIVIKIGYCYKKKIKNKKSQKRFALRLLCQRLIFTFQNVLNISWINGTNVSWDTKCRKCSNNFTVIIYVFFF
jgi:hypothetical protein